MAKPPCLWCTYVTRYLEPVKQASACDGDVLGIRSRTGITSAYTSTNGAQIKRITREHIGEVDIHVGVFEQGVS